MTFPTHARYVIVGAGIHGLATAWRLAERLEASGKGSGADILVLDKTAIAAAPAASPAAWSATTISSPPCAS